MNVIIVTGGREYSHAQKVNSTLDNEKPNLIVVGDAKRKWLKTVCSSNPRSRVARSMSRHVPVIEKLLSGEELDPSAVDDAIVAWHGADTSMSLPQWLGLTLEEYAIYVEMPAALSSILASRRYGVTVADIGSLVMAFSGSMGGCLGADALAREWARKNCVPCLVFYADWTKYGRAAGPKRNEDMLLFVQENFGHEHTCKLVAFPGGNGTANCIERAHIINFNVLVITDER